MLERQSLCCLHLDLRRWETGPGQSSRCPHHLLGSSVFRAGLFFLLAREANAAAVSGQVAAAGIFA